MCGVCRGRFLLARFVLCRRRAARASSALGSLVASAGRVRPGRWGLPVAAAGLGAVVRWGCGRGRVLVARRRVGLRWRLVGLGRFPARRSPLCWRGGSGLGRLGAGGRAAICPAVAASGAACARLGFWRLGWRFLSPPWRAARRRGGAAAARQGGVSVTAPVLPPAVQTAAGLPLSPG